MDQLKPRLDDLRIERRTKPESKSRFGLVLIVLFLLALLGGSIWWLKRPKGIALQTVVVRETSGAGADRTVLNASGYVTARRAATVSAKITGKVMEVTIEEGMKVQEGQILARLDDTNVRASLRLAEAQLAAATNALGETEVRIREAERELQRQVEMQKNKISTQSDYDRAEATALALKARLEQQKAEVIVAERQVASWQQQMEDTIIRAPFSGIVTSKNAQPGEMISPISAGGGFTRTGICTIVDMQSLEIEVDVNESYITRVEPDQPVEAMLDAYPEWKIPCKVIAIIPTADRQKSTVKVRVGFDKLDKRVIPEMSVKVAFRETSTAGSVKGRTIIVPKTALRQENGREVVFVMQNGRAERRAVTVSNTLGEEATITAGLAAGEKVVVDPAQGLQDGVEIRDTGTTNR